jgi:hypothetical protein
MPTRYVMPTEELGEYEGPGRRRSAPARPTPPARLYPLAEEGKYGAPPAPTPRPLPPYMPRERKPKVYASYNVDSECTVHAKQPEKEWGGSEAHRRPSWSSRASSSSATRRRSSASPARRTVSSSPSRQSDNASVASSSNARLRKGSPENITNLYNARNARKLSGMSQGGGGGGMGEGRPGYSSASWDTSSRSSVYSSNSNSSSGLGVQSRKTSSGSGPTVQSRKTSSSSYNRNYGGNLRDTSFEENEEYEYEENQKRTDLATSKNKYSSFARSGSDNEHNYSSSSSSARKPSLGLGTMRKPQIDSWDSMGILGLTARIWSDTRQKQDTFMSSTTGSFLREGMHGANTYIM